jgi:hypothetical protein
MDNTYRFMVVTEANDILDHAAMYDKAKAAAEVLARNNRPMLFRVYDTELNVTVCEVKYIKGVKFLYERQGLSLVQIEPKVPEEQTRRKVFADWNDYFKD